MRFNKKTIRDIPVEGQTVILRADYNVPIEDGKIRDDYRIKKSLETIEYLLDRKCRIVIISHLGRPGGKADASFSLAPVAKRLTELLHQSVDFIDECVGEKVSRFVQNMPHESVVLLENLRFHSEEKKDDYGFASRLAKDTGARYFIQDGFGVVHRAHASTDAITHFIPAVSGLLLEKEVNTITSSMENPERPLVAIIGGAKISDKIDVISRFVEKADKILIGGAMANTFLKKKGYNLGKSKVEDDQNDIIDKIYDLAKQKLKNDDISDFIILPEDVAVGKNIDDQNREVVALDNIKDDDMVLDIGYKTIEKYCSEIEKAKTVVWNGTLGYAENRNFSHGSARAALSIASTPGLKSVIGGGDTANFVLHWDGHGGKSFDHISTGGGASLELMSGQKLPGVVALLEK